ncbi:MAG: hypothetical protein BGO51_01370 [Rhodospirillales bacterium 69-11]|nr:glycosyltransferase [Rhodospirillales bacterium]OJW25651.1 MAG: hypothetical protein BGO51_01370 [Rhodospirillales bacterium 69-11]
MNPVAGRPAPAPAPAWTGLGSVDAEALARAARDRGIAALAGRNLAEALRWLDRAHRLVPRDPNVALTLGSALIGEDTARAVTLLTELAAELRIREAWQALATAQMVAGDPVAGAASMAEALRHGVAAPEMAALATELARRAGAPGWVGITAEGALALETIDPGDAGAGRLVLRLDGRVLRDRPGVAPLLKGSRLEAAVGARPLLGSPLDLRALRRVVGCVAERDGGIEGWAWVPANPSRPVALTVRPAGGGRGFTILAEEEIVVADAGPLARPRAVRIDAAQLRGRPGPWHVTGPEGRDLLGSPLDPTAAARAATAAAAALARFYPAGGGRTAVAAASIALPPPALPVGDPPPPEPARAPTAQPARAPMAPEPARAPMARPAPHGPADVVVPVHGKPRLVEACLDSVLSTLPDGSRVVVVDDGSEDPAIDALLVRFAADPRVQVIRLAHNRGFPAAANAGIAACPGRDVVLLNSDTLVPPHWLERLAAAVHAAPMIGSATPLSNDASILSYPATTGRNPVPDLAATRRLSALAARANPDGAVDIPVGVGFCFYIRRACLDAVGGFRDDVFAQGYGEENDFCLRARHLGWRHVAVTNVFVAHHSGASFGGPGRHLQRRNQDLLERLHPGYGALIQRFGAADPLAPARRRLDVARWRAAAGKAEGVLLVTHAEGGGVERRITAACAAHRAAGRRPIVLRPTRLADDTPAVLVSDGQEDDFPNLRYRLPAEAAELARLLRGVQSVEVHHLLDHPPAIYDLLARIGVPWDVHVHDYAWFCPQLALVDGTRRYCGEPALAGCEACVADHGALMREPIAVPALRARSEAFLRAARAVIVPSQDVAARMRRHFRGVRMRVVPHGEDAAIARPAAPAPRDGRCRVCVVGAVGVHKGYDVLLACARDAAARRLPLDFVLVGTSIDDQRLMATGRVFVTGGFTPGEAVPLIRAQRASIGFVPSIWPETWCLALTELWEAGLQAAAFDLGTPAERIRRTGFGTLLPLSLPPSAINAALLGACGLARP